MNTPKPVPLAERRRLAVESLIWIENRLVAHQLEGARLVARWQELKGEFAELQRETARERGDV